MLPSPTSSSPAPPLFSPAFFADPFPTYRALGSILRRFPRLRLTPDEVRWRQIPVFRGLEALRVAF